jgi:hypothetical protein
MLDIVGFIVAIIVAVVGTRYAMKKQKSRSFDGYTVKKLEESGFDISKEHLLEFWFYSNKEEAINKVADDLKQRNFEVIVNQTEEDPRYVIRALKSLIPDIGALLSLRVEFDNLAKLHGAEYDGWGCSS